ncbi:hypothetical protein BD779DRAFT_1480521 [Infundibulicybe gibba]|nr:hypothetical protein BD779DRAFT_1480521 [Infundibulicybe gibba]
MGRRLSPPYRTRLEAFPLHPPHHIINVDLLAIDRNKALPTFQEPRSVWRANRLIIVIIAIALIATASIVAGVVVGLKPKKGTANLASNGASPALSSSSTPSSTSQTPVASSLPIPDNLQLSFKSSSWIWLDQNGLSGVPGGDYAFRKTLPNSATPPTEVIALLAVDNSFSLYHNGQLVSAGAGWTQSTAAYIRLDPNSNVFAIQVRNYADINGTTQAGLLASFQIKYTDGSTSTLSADNTWRVTYPAPSGFQFPTFDDSRWISAMVLGQYGIQPWGSSTGFPSSVVLSNPVAEHLNLRADVT